MIAGRKNGEKIGLISSVQKCQRGGTTLVETNIGAKPETGAIQTLVHRNYGPVKGFELIW